MVQAAESKAQATGAFEAFQNLLGPLIVIITLWNLVPIIVILLVCTPHLAFRDSRPGARLL